MVLTSMIGGTRVTPTLHKTLAAAERAASKAIRDERGSVGYAALLGSKIIQSTRMANNILRGREARLNTTRAGKYNGRTGLITNVMPDATHGLLALVMVWNTTRKGSFLNAEPETRSYWPLDDLSIAVTKSAAGAKMVQS